MVKNPPANVGDVGSIPGLRRSAGGEVATHSRILAWEIPWTEEPGRLQSLGLQRGGHDWSDWAQARMSNADLSPRSPQAPRLRQQRQRWFPLIPSCSRLTQLLSQHKLRRKCSSLHYCSEILQTVQKLLTEEVSVARSTLTRNPSANWAPFLL